MPNNELTGSEDIRFDQLQKYWLTFEPVSDEDASILNHLFTVPLGQTKAPELLIESGSITTNISGAIEIEKDIHVFDDESEANQFLTEIGPENISSYFETEVNRPEGGTTKRIEIHVVSSPMIDFNFVMLDAEQGKGYIVEVFISGAKEETGRIDLEPVSRKAIFDKNGRLISDTYVKFFTIKTDQEGFKQNLVSDIGSDVLLDDKEEFL